MPTYPQVSSIGIVIEYQVLTSLGLPKDLTGATGKKFIMKRPDRVVIERDADFSTDGTDGMLKYTTVAGDAFPHGTWQIQPYYVLPDGFDGRAEVKVFDLEANL